MAMEEARRDLQRRLEEVLGKEHALTLMAQLPRDEPVTRTELRTELERVEARLAERIDLKVESAEHRTIAALERSHGSLRKDMAAQTGDLRKDMAAQTRVFVFSTLTAVVAVGGLAVAAGRFG